MSEESTTALPKITDTLRRLRELGLGSATPEQAMMAGAIIAETISTDLQLSFAALGGATAGRSNPYTRLTDRLTALNIPESSAKAIEDELQAKWQEGARILAGSRRADISPARRIG